MIVVGIDPGIHGAMACYDTASGHLIVEDIPSHVWKSGTTKKRRIDLYGMARIIDDWNMLPIHRAVVEAVSSMPSQGVTSTFNFGKTAGICEMVIAANLIPLATVRPHIWKGKLRLRGQDKDAARARASELFPWQSHYFRRKKDDGRAESALLAYYGANHWEVE